MPKARSFRLAQTVTGLGLALLWLCSGWLEQPHVPFGVEVARATTNTYTTSTTWTVPDGVTTATIETWGGGGGGGTSNAGEGGGGGGAYAASTVSVSAGDNWTVTVGGGGGAGSDGGASSVTHATTTVSAAGGSTPTGNGRGAGAGGTTAASSGTTLHAGGNGGSSSGNNAGGGGGGSSSGTAANGNNGNNNSSGTGGNGGTAPTGGYAGGKGGNNGAAGAQGPDTNGGAGGGGGGASANAAAGRPGLVKITYPIVSVTVADGGVAYGMVVTSQNTTASGVNDTQAVTNAGEGAEDFNIKGQNSANWTLAGTAGTDQYVHEFCTAGSGTPDPCDASPSWTALTTSYQTLAANVAAAGTRRFDLKLTVPTTTGATAQQSVDVTIQAVQH